MKSFVSGLLALLLTLPLGAQNQSKVLEVVLSFVSADNRESIPRVICRVYDAQGQMVGHTLADSQGQARMRLDPNRAQRITCSRLGFEPLELKTTELLSSGFKQYALKPKAAQLKELVVRPPAIRQRKDTVIYNASEFLKKEDRYAADLLQRMPGLSVNRLGRVEYQGKPISRFYIEGKDLLGSNYDAATRTLDAKAIQGVQVLEGHQHAKILRSKVATDQAALNIQLKKEYKSRWQGEAQLGTGLPAPLVNGKMSLMRFGDSQSLSALEGNNNGHELSVAGRTLSIADLAYAEVLLFGEETVLSHDIGTRDISREYYLDNQSLRWTLNHLIKPAEESSFRINLLGSAERKHYTSFSRDSYAAGANLVVEQNERERLSNFFLTPSISYEKNSQQLYLTNVLTASISRSHLTDDITTPSMTVDQVKRARPLNISNLFTTMIGIGRHMYALKSNIRYQDQHERLGVQGGVAPLDASYRHSHLTTKNHIGSSWSLWSGRLESGLTAYYDRARYSTQLGERATLAHRSELLLALSTSYRYTWDCGELHISLPLTYTYNELSPRDRSSVSHRLFSPNPNLSLQYTLGYHAKLKWDASAGRTLESGAYYSTIPIVRSYRYRTQALDILLPSSYWRTSISLDYKIPAQLFFVHFKGTYRHSSKDYYIDYDYQAQETQTHIVAGHNASKTLQLQLQADKQFFEPQFKLQGKLGYTRHSSLMSQQGRSFDNLGETYTASLSLSWHKLSWFEVESSLNASLSKQSSEVGTSPSISDYSSSMGIVLRPQPKYAATLSLQSSIREISPRHFVGTHFLNASCRYTFNKSLEARLTASNLLNKQDYEVFSVQGPNTSYYRLPLRGRELLMSLSFRF